MKDLSLALCVAVVAGSADAETLADRAAKIFAEACLSPMALSLGNGSEAAEGAAAVAFAGDVFFRHDRKGLSKGMVGTPEYAISEDRSTGKLHCFVASKDLSTADVEGSFSFLIKAAGQGKKPTATGPAKWDDGPSRPIDGREATFKSKGRKLRLEAVHFTSDRGPVGAFVVTIEHTVSGS